MILPIPNLFSIKGFIVLRACVPQRVMMRMIALNDNSPRPITTAGPTSYLGDQLKSPFRRSKVGQSKAGIHRNYTDQCDVREVVALREHLRSHQHVQLSCPKIQQRLFKLTTPRSGVAINARDPQFRKEALE